MEDQSISSAEEDLHVEDGEDIKPERNGVTQFVFRATHDAKLRELLHKISSFEVKLCSDGAKEFVKLLKSDSGGELLRLYVTTSSGFSELMGSWKLRQGKPGLRYVMSLISAILGHVEGRYKPDDRDRIAVSRVIDKFAKVLIEEKLEDVCKELNSKEPKRQNAALGLVASIVRRGSGLASDVAKNFNFKLQAFLKLAEYERRGNRLKKKPSLRNAFVGFAMSFLEVGKPGLLRWILQQKEMYSGVLRGLGNDDEETITYVLSVLQNRVLAEQSLVSPGLRSVLFGSITLEQLVGVSGRENGGPVAELAHNVLVTVCTDPSNGLMPDLKRHPNPLKGNPKRLLGLMKKLKAAEIGYHRDLLLAIVKGKTYFASGYLEEFPYNIEDCTSPIWFGAVSLAADLLSSVARIVDLRSQSSQSGELASFSTLDLEIVIKCISTRPFSRSTINKVLQHDYVLVKNGALRLLLESLKLLDYFFEAIDSAHSEEKQIQKWLQVKEDICNDIWTVLPDPQLLVKLLSTMISEENLLYVLTRKDCSSLKRTATEGRSLEDCGKREKRSKEDNIKEDNDIVVGGISNPEDICLNMDSENGSDSPRPDVLDGRTDFPSVLSGLWGSELCFSTVSTTRDAYNFFNSKLLDALRIYVRIIPTALEGQFDFFMKFLSNPLVLPMNLQYSLLFLVVEYISSSPKRRIAIRTPPGMYKYLQPFINLLVFSSSVDIKVHAYDLVQAAFSSTGAFDRNVHEIDAWLLFLPGCNPWNSSVEAQGSEVLQSLSPVVISFLCEAISTIGNHLFRYWDTLYKYICSLEEFRDSTPSFSPFIVCILEKCVRLLSSESKNFTLPQKTMISLYVCNSVRYILQTQVDARLLSAVVRLVVAEGPQLSCLIQDPAYSCCEWRPLKNLLLFLESISHQQTSLAYLIDEIGTTTGDSFAGVLGEVQKIVESVPGVEVSGAQEAFSSALLCTFSGDLLKSFPSYVTFFQRLQVPISIFTSAVYLEQSFLVGVSKFWPKIFFSGLEMAVSMIESYNTENSSTQPMMLNVEYGSSESEAIAAFGLLLREVPFHILFPAVMGINFPHLLVGSKMKDLLVAKLTQCTTNCIARNMQLLLFWFNQVQVTYRIKPCTELKLCAELCCILVKHLVSQLLVCKRDSESLSNGGVSHSWNTTVEVAETIFSHPLVSSSLNCPLNSEEDFTSEGNIGETVEVFLNFSKQCVNKIDLHVLDILTTTFDCLVSLSCEHSSLVNVQGGSRKQLVKVHRALVERLYQVLKDKLELYFKTSDLLCLLHPFYALHALIWFASPFKLLKLSQWIFSRAKANDLADQTYLRVSPLSLGLCIAAGAFKTLTLYLRQPLEKRACYCTLWEIEEKNFDLGLVGDIFSETFEIATDFKLELAYDCLLNAVHAAYRQKHALRETFQSSCMAFSRIVSSIHINIISQCINGISKTKARLLFLLVEMSPLHLSLFGKLFFGILSGDFSLMEKTVDGNSDSTISDEDFLLLLPAAFSYCKSVLRFGNQYFEHLTAISSFYSRMLLEGFHQWKKFVSKRVFEEDFDDFLPTTFEELISLVQGSLLLKAVKMLQHYISLNSNMEKQLRLFDSVIRCSASHDGLLDVDAEEMEFSSVTESLNLINRVVAKISLCHMLLFAKKDCVHSLPEEFDSPLNGTSLGQSRMRFVKVLVDAWQSLVKSFPSDSVDCKEENTTGCSQLYRFLELYILRTLVGLTIVMRDALVQLKSISFLEQLVKSSLLYRFEDLITLKALRKIIVLLSDGKFSSPRCLQLLLAHSQFASTICIVSESFCSQVGAFLKPMSSILRSVAISEPTAKVGHQTSALYLKQLGILKLLRTLIQIKCQQIDFDHEKDIGINLKELHFMLLSSYGATLSEVDLEIYSLMVEIQCIDKSTMEDVVDMDYLWGSAALKSRRERDLVSTTSSDMIDTETVDDHRRNQFRENIPVDPKMCVATVLNFPYDRNVNHGPLLLNKLTEDDFRDVDKIKANTENSRRYDPIFILRFSIHALSMGYFEPVEFAGLGLLAVAFVSLSSPSIEMRRLGYECLAMYKAAAEKCQKKKEIMRLRLLLTYMQNGIEEPWQKVPSVIALFAAEASFILLDPANDHYSTISKHLMHSSKVHMKYIPLFDSFFHSSSVNFRTERLWMLRLACAGLNLEDDAQIYIRNSIMEKLMSFFSSPLSDNDSKDIILQVVKKSVKFQKMVRYLVERCGLIPWLSSILSISRVMSNGDETKFFSRQLVMVTKAVLDIVSSEEMIEWLQNFGFEQLGEFTTHLYQVLVGGLKLMKENHGLIDSILHIVKVTLQISQQRKLDQPHFTLSSEALFLIYRVCDVCGGNAESAVEAILMNTPPTDIFDMNKEKLSGFLLWAISTALRQDTRHRDSSIEAISMEEPLKESLLSKLLCQLAASVTNRKRCRNSNLSKGSSDNEELIAATVFYIQQLLGLNCEIPLEH